MIRRLTILLLIVGCAPTVAFHIGISKQEFENNIRALEKEKIKVEFVTSQMLWYRFI